MIREYKETILFLVKYVVIYVVLNTAYAYYVAYYSPNADPVTVVVTKHTAGLLSLFDSSIDYTIEQGSKNVPVRRDARTVMMVFEGCNSLNVMIVFLTFIISFKGPFKFFVCYLLFGLLAVYMINLLRLMGLFTISLHFPDQFYFFHKFFFTGIIYLVVFVIWYFWVRDIKKWKLQSGTEG